MLSVKLCRNGKTTRNPGRSSNMRENELLKRYQQGERDFRGLKLRDIYLRDVCLQGIDLSCADLRGASLMSVNLRGANLHRADLSEAFLIHANLSSANLTQANLTKAFLILANLHQSCLTEANLSHTNLTKANLSEVSGFAETLCDHTILTRVWLPQFDAPIQFWNQFRLSMPEFSVSAWIKALS